MSFPMISSDMANISEKLSGTDGSSEAWRADSGDGLLGEEVRSATASLPPNS